MCLPGLLATQAAVFVLLKYFQWGEIIAWDGWETRGQRIHFLKSLTRFALHDLSESTSSALDKKNSFWQLSDEGTNFTFTYPLHAMWHIRCQHFHQPALSAAATCTSLQFFHPALSLSLSVVLFHVVLGLPHFPHPSGVRVNGVLQSLFNWFFLMMWPKNFHLFLRTSSLRFSISVICRPSLFVILSCQRILNICLRHLLWKTSILLSTPLYIFYVSQHTSRLALPVA